MTAEAVNTAETLVELGTFEVISGQLDVSDPCYARDVWCRLVLDNVRKGTWHAGVSLYDFNDSAYGRDRRVTALTIAHEEYKDSDLDSEKAIGHIGVDSGQAGFFDSAHYKDDSIVTDEMLRRRRNTDRRAEPGERWYDLCCEVTLGQHYDEIQRIYQRINPYDGPLQLSMYEESIKTIAEGKFPGDSEQQLQFCRQKMEARAAEHEKLRKRYDEIRDLDVHAGVIPYGVVSASGFGDGGYDLFIHRADNGEIVAAEIVFIVIDDDDDEDLDVEYDDIK